MNKKTKKQGFLYYKFLVYFYLYFSSTIAFLLGLAFLSGGFVTLDVYISSMKKINLIIAIFQFVKSVTYVVAAIRMREFRWYSDKIFIWIKLANFLVMTIYTYVLYRFVGSVDVYDCTLTILITGISLYLNHAYFKNREEYFTE